MIFQSFVSRDKTTMLNLLKQLILPKIDFRSVLWAPYKIQDPRNIEKIQANYTRRIQLSSNDLDYWERLKELKLYSIERRFERYMIIYLWKILHELVDNPGIKFRPNQETRRGVLSKVASYTRQLRENSFMVRGPNLFNKLPKDLRNFPYIDRINPQKSIDTFKKHLDSFLSTIPDQPNMSGEYTKRIEGLMQNCQRTNSILRSN